jgi:RimJ/RimL family protein N-acetyltransferase
MLKGKNVLLRPVRRTDISYFLKWFNDPEVIQYLTMYLPMTEMGEEKWIEELANRAGSTVNFAIEAIGESANQPIGSIGLHNINPKDQAAHFGIVIGEKDYWSKGHGSEATRLLIEYGFKQLNLHRISSSVFAFNERSIRMHKKVGFKEEGRLRQADFKNGHFHDRVMFGLLRDEWNVSSNPGHVEKNNTDYQI